MRTQFSLTKTYFLTDISEKSIGKHLILEKEKLLEGKGKKIEGNIINSIEVYQYEKSTEISEKITEFNLQFINKADLQNEFTAILPVLEELKMGQGEKQTYLLDYFGDVYGLTDQNTILKYIEEFLINSN